MYFNLLSIPIYERYSDENIFKVISKLLYSRGGEYYNVKLIGMAFNDVANVTGHLSVVVARISRECSGEVYKIWCGAHQLDLAVQDVFDDHIKEQFQDPLHRLIIYLPRQTNLIFRMGSKYTTIAVDKISYLDQE